MQNSKECIQKFRALQARVHTSAFFT